jgi:hypothetical protein
MNFRTARINSTALSFAITMLKQELESLQKSETDQFRPELLFWILFIGGCATSGHPERHWFRCQLAAVCKKLGLVTWVEAKAILSKFAWVEESNGLQQKILWDEVFHLGTQELENVVVCERPLLRIASTGEMRRSVPGMD